MSALNQILTSHRSCTIICCSLPTVPRNFVCKKKGKIITFNPLNPNGYNTYHQLKNKKSYTMPTQCIYVFCVDIRTAIISLHTINCIVFRCVHKIAKKRPLTLSCPFVRPHEKTSASTGRIFMKFDMSIFFPEKLSRKFKLL